MQALSGMQRSGDDALALKWLLFFALLFLYEPLTTVLIYLPPLLGVAAWSIVRSNGAERIFWLFYLYFFEVDHGLPFFSLFATLMLYAFFSKRLREYVACRTCLFFLTTSIFYALFIFVLLFYSHLLSIDVVVDYKLLIYYTFADGLVYYAF